MTYQLSAEDQRYDRALTAATQAIVMLAYEPGRLKALVTGLERYGESFAAFMLAPEVKEVFAGDLHDMYRRSYLFTGTSLKNATEQLLERSGWRLTIQALHRDTGGIASLPWDESRLREVLAEGYELIPAIKGVHVFDRRPLAVEYED
ncbi:hypothetical protein ICM05_08695 [Leucobacter sp. cx-42]|uniref:hypothetical protein n=1 Tax=unclassified Leucobacter TaxID=2621730 RepID=UPI00165D513F|nr:MULTISPECIES: hypothetical protein [unclassified Leucobacter]MBC9954720.1 hypothetical protein [Leucobacter sp. cx-42]